ncbi:uncharacterized protein MONBRDRAFT_33944 [Monosiga brevicollis MX1]|uniref:VPS9 domain-containing protein n=1 Tax=Monosiga brevicollis TaxID=81824 RepID=A9V8N4_MONBE|nr:uncharacterized protein MONBRDRAFT_33944 [Monosiga brevicollis MX1]EDQ86115.1 predicted protein [Monosiga brevicollis MX1]|eukprot:XP_001749040.1 hypothetical protein [Monosiga brevicollis MX1]
MFSSLFSCALGLQTLSFFLSSSLSFSLSLKLSLKLSVSLSLSLSLKLSLSSSLNSLSLSLKLSLKLSLFSQLSVSLSQTLSQTLPLSVSLSLKLSLSNSPSLSLLSLSLSSLSLFRGVTHRDADLNELVAHATRLGRILKSAPSSDAATAQLLHETHATALRAGTAQSPAAPTSASPRSSDTASSPAPSVHQVGPVARPPVSPSAASGQMPNYLSQAEQQNRQLQRALDARAAELLRSDRQAILLLRQQFENLQKAHQLQNANARAIADREQRLRSLVYRQDAPDEESAQLRELVIKFDSASQEVSELLLASEKDPNEANAKRLVGHAFTTLHHPLRRALKHSQYQTYQLFNQEKLPPEDLLAYCQKSTRALAEQFFKTYHFLRPQTGCDPAAVRQHRSFWAKLLAREDGLDKIHEDADAVDIMSVVERQIEDVYFDDAIWGVLRKASEAQLLEQEQHFHQATAAYRASTARREDLLPEAFRLKDANGNLQLDAATADCAIELHRMPIQGGPRTKVENFASLLERISQQVASMLDEPIGAELLVDALKHVIMYSGRYALVYELFAIDRLLPPTEAHGILGYTCVTWQIVLASIIQS